MPKTTTTTDGGHTIRHDPAVPVDQLDPAPYNPRKITDDELAKLAASIEAFGLVEPLVANADGTLIGGHQRLRAAIELGLEVVPVNFVDLDDAAAKALNLALNNIEGEWDYPKLITLLDSLDDAGRALGGFDPERLQSVRFHYRRAANADADRVGRDEYGRDNVPTLPENPRHNRGDVVRIGSHLVYCADSTDPAVWERIGRGHLVVTSPPYPGAVMWNTDDEDDAGTFDANVARLDELNLAVFEHSLANADVVAWNVADVPIGPNRVAPTSHKIRGYLLEHGIAFREIVWDKGVPILPPAGHMRRPVLNSITHELVFIATHQPIFVIYPQGWKPREKRSGLAKGQNEWQLRSVWTITPAKRSRVGHPAPFPLELAERSIYLYTLVGDTVIDPFAGAGTTLLAAERTGRTAVLIELEPGWVDLIVDRAKAELDIDAEVVDNIAP